MKKIKLGIDARILSQPMNGVARYATELLKNLPKYERFEVHLFSDTPLREEYRPYFSNYHLVLFNNSRFKKYWKNWILPFQLLKHRIDIYHAVWDKGVPFVSPCPIVMTIHDLYSISNVNNAISKKKKFCKFVNVFIETFKSKKILTVSESTKKDIVHKLRVFPEKIVVTYLGCNRHYIEKMMEEGGALPVGLRSKEYFVSIVGRLDDVRKNTFFLIRSFNKFLLETEHQNKRYKLVIVGSYDKYGKSYKSIKMLIDAYDLKNDVVLTGYLTDAVLYNLIHSSKGMLFPSLFEGFGVPLLEAFLMGAPVITSNVSSMPEIASGGSALLIDPTSEEELVTAMASLCADAVLRKNLVENGYKRLRDFDWDLTIKKIIRVYHDILE